MATKPSIDSVAIGRFLTIELARATELAAVAAARFRGRGDEMAAGEAALLAMRSHLALLPAHGRVVIGEGASASAFILAKLLAHPPPPMSIWRWLRLKARHCVSRTCLDPFQLLLRQRRTHY